MSGPPTQRLPDDEPLARIAARRAVRKLRAEAATPEFGRLLILQASSAAGDALIALALAGTLYFSVPATGARSNFVVYLLLTMAPFAIVGPVLARFLDTHRGGLRTAMFVSALGRAGLALFLGPRLESLWLFPIAFGVLVLSRAQVVVRGALLPHVLPEGRGLVAANSSLAKVAALAGAVVVLPGAALLQYPGVRTMLTFAAAIYAIGAPAAFGLPRARGRRTESEQSEAKAILTSAVIRQSSVAAAGMRLIVGFLVFHLALALRREEFGNVGLGLLLGGAALGSFLGALTSPRLRRVLKEEGMLAVGLSFAGIAGLVAGRWFSLALSVALVVVVGIASGASKLAFDSIVQREVAEAGRGYAFARFESILQLAWVAGGLIAVAIPFPSGGGVAGAGAVGLGVTVLYVIGRSQARARRPRGGKA